MLDTGWGSQEVMPALQKDNIPLVPDVAPGLPIAVSAHPGPGLRS